MMYERFTALLNALTCILFVATKGKPVPITLEIQSVLFLIFRHLIPFFFFLAKSRTGENNCKAFFLFARPTVSRVLPWRNWKWQTLLILDGRFQFKMAGVIKTDVFSIYFQQVVNI